MRYDMGSYDWDECGIKAIRKHALFLEKKGYDYRFFAGAVHYEKKGISISVHNRHLDEYANVLIKFIEQNETFSLTRFNSTIFSNNYVMPNDPVLHVITLIQLLEKHFPELTSLEHCIALERQIDQRSPAGSSTLELLIRRRDTDMT